MEKEMVLRKNTGWMANCGPKETVSMKKEVVGGYFLIINK
jgi:hypothetical protein